MQWYLRTETIPQSLEELKQLLLLHRQVPLEQTQAFFKIMSPFLVTTQEVGFDQIELNRAIKRLAQAIQNQEQIVVFGDYDADGISATTITLQILLAVGAKVDSFIPSRELHGYGLSLAAITEVVENLQPKLVITVDNGIVAFKPVAALLDRGIDCIITDHHQPEAELPKATAVVYSTQLCGATVAWMFLKAFLEDFKPDLVTKLLEPQLDLCGIATIADQVPLQKQNRIFAQAGIAALQVCQRPGLLALYKEANIDPKTTTTTTIHYGIGPRLNAMGRLANASVALDLLTANDLVSAQTIASVLSDVNTQRQGLTSGSMEIATNLSTEYADEAIVIVDSPQFHEGVIGLIAGKLVEKLYKPAIALSYKGTTAKASVRSLPGVNIIEILRQIKGDLLELGGHPMAAGFSVELAKLPIIKQKLQQIAKEQIPPELLIPSLSVEMYLPQNLVNFALIDCLAEFQPFGQSNPEPVFGLSGLQIVQTQTMGSTKQHLRLQLIKPDTVKPLTAIAWNQGHQATSFNPGQLIDIAGHVVRNDWKGKSYLQVMIKDLKPAEFA